MKNRTMKNRMITLAALVLALSPAIALASSTPSNGHSHAQAAHDRSPHVHDRGLVAHR